MNKVSVIFIGLMTVFLSGVGQAEDTVKSERDGAVEQTLKVLADAHRFNFGKSVAFCGSIEAPDRKVIEQAFDRYMTNLSTGLQAGMNAIGKTEKFNPPSDDLMQGKSLEMQIKQRDFLLKTVQANPPVGCGKLIDYFNASSPKVFQGFIETGYREYKEKRKALCSRDDRPKNCDEEAVEK